MAKWNGRTGLDRPATEVGSIEYCDLVVSPLAAEALRREGHKVTPHGVILDPTKRVPSGIHVHMRPRDERLWVRMETEPPAKDECRASWWERGYFEPCPECGAPLAWYEAGYVPGYRVCTRPPHHHVTLL